ncbi:MAG: glycosyltransferase [Alphaproteobacteria bacterium]|jgi:hypothetical protein
MQILYVGNGNYKHRGSRYYDVGRKILNGLIRNGHNVYFFSDRDVSRSSNLFGSLKLGKRYCNNAFIDTCYNFAPELILFGHADIINIESIVKVKTILPNVKMAQFNVDPVFRPHNIAQINSKAPYMDATFITTAGDILKKFSHPRGLVSYIPNPIDGSMEWPRCHERSDQPNDIFWAMRSGGGSSYPEDPRFTFPIYLEQTGKIKIDYHGINGKPELLNAQYYKEIEKSRMGINISVERAFVDSPIASANELYLYSSDRISHYMGSGLLTLARRGNRLEELFKEDKELVLFESKEELAEKVIYFNHHDEERKKIAYAGWKKSHQQLNERLVAKYILETTFRLKLTEDYVWPTQTY